MAELHADVLAKLLLLQNVVGQLPDEASIFSFVCRGLQDMPGVTAARFEPEAHLAQDRAPAELDRLPLALGNKRYGEFVLHLGNRSAYEPYAAFVGNLLFMVAVILEERRQRRLNAEYQHDLEERVRERTRQLTDQMEVTKAAELAAHAQKHRAERYLEVSEAIIVELDPTGCVTVINKRGLELLDRPAAAVLGHDWFDLAIPPDVRGMVRQSFQETMRENGELRGYFDHQIRARTGTRRHIAWHNECLRAADGSICGTLSSGIDITESKEAELALSAEKERLAVTLRSIGDGVITTDTQGRIAVMNRVAESLTGWSWAEAVGRPLLEVFHIVDEETRRPSTNPCDKVLATGQIVELANHTVLIARDRTERPIADSGAPIRNRDGTTIGVVLVFRDMTEKQKLLADAQRNDRLNALGVLAGGIAHDFNNLLGGLFGSISLAERQNTDPEVARHLRMGLTVFNRARDLAQQLLTFAKGGAPVRQIGRPGPLLRESVLFALSGSPITTTFRIAENLWNCSFDKNQMAQVFDNLAINARQAMPDGGNILVVADNVEVGDREHAALPAGRYVKLSLTDTGTGIAKDQLSHIFDPFFTTKQAGSGLGLATCHSIVHRHGGSIEVESTPGQGTTFDVFLPASPDATDEVPPTPAAVHRGRGLLLVMDDEVFLREIMKATLRTMGYDTVLTNDGTEALQRWREFAAAGTPLCGAFLDLTIRGGLGGKAVAAEMRRSGAAFPLFATSGYSEDPVIANPGDFGFTASLKKPFTVEDIAALLDRHVKR